MGGVLIDVVAQCTEGPRMPTCKGTTAIDHFLVTRALLHQHPVATQSSHRWPQDHCVLDMFVDIRFCQQRLLKFKPPAALPSACATPMPCELDAAWSGPLNVKTFEDALAHGQLDRAYSLWSIAWETLLLDRAQTKGCITDDSAVGRGLGPGYFEYIPHSTASKHDGMEEPLRSPWSVLLSKLRRLRSQLKRDPLSDDGPTLLHNVAFHVEDGWHLDLDTDPRADCDSSSGSCEEARSHKYIKGESCRDWATPLTCVTLDDGSVVTELTQMDLAVTQAWQKVAQPTGTTLEESRQHLEELAECIPNSEPVPLRPVTAKDLMKALKKAKPRRSPGERGWHACDGPPPGIGLGSTCAFDQQGRSDWVKVSNDCQSTKPLSLRPIGVLPTLARIWARARVEELLKRTIHVFPVEMFGELRGRSARQLIARVLLHLDAGLPAPLLQGAGCCNPVI
eukprot:6475113-Amphidinium_carterae.1